MLFWDCAKGRTDFPAGGDVVRSAYIVYDTEGLRVRMAQVKYEGHGSAWQRKRHNACTLLWGVEACNAMVFA